MKRGNNRIPCLSLCSVLVLTTISCYREIRIVRKLFYPPEMNLAGGPGPDTPGRSVSWPRYAEILRRYVDTTGRVNYGGLREKQSELDLILQQMGQTEVASLSRYEQIALYVNVYNAATLKLIVENPGLKSIQDIPAPQRWKDRRWDVGGQLLSLDDLEHEILRKEYKLPWVHFALTCASKGCPILRNTPYTGKHLMAELKAQTEHFFQRPDSYRLDPSRNQLHVSELMDWYRGDLETFAGSLLDFIADYAPAADQDFLRANRPRIHFLAYSWDLNGYW